MCQEKSHQQTRSFPPAPNLRKKYIFLITFFFCIAGVPESYPQTLPRNPNLPIVVIDPGHGGINSGAKGVNRLFEKDITLRLALDVATRLQDSCIVFLTRESDTNPDTYKRIELANNKKANLFISLHTGGGFSQSPGPLHILHTPDASDALTQDPPLWFQGHPPYAHQSIQLAKILSETLRQTLSPPKKIVVEARTLPLLTPLVMPAIILELGNLSAPKDAMWLTETDTRKKLSLALAQAIHSYLATNF